MKDGIVVINKEENITSQGVVNRVKSIFGVKKAGHTGTLDPMATGVLPVLIGRGVKASEYMISSEKHYVATLLLGITTDTEDVTGEVLSSSDAIPDEDAVIEAARSFVGEYMQTPPMYSALKVGGKKLCDLARKGIEIEREPRKITVYSLDVVRISEREYSLDVVCSSGTYIRTLCADIGKKLGCGGVMKTLCRASASVFSLNDAHTLGELIDMDESAREALVIPIERVFEKYREVRLSAFFERLARSGLEIYLHKIGFSAEAGERVRLLGESGFFALGEVREYEGGLAIKPIKQFDV
ncbi:MAG: tRNA pseudouridine(55) synthase TruB [Clostridia bacterium]|nr:tRNA pseudouridine(55) synthase TruB [Clostridia bacterium]